MDERAIQEQTTLSNYVQLTDSQPSQNHIFKPKLIQVLPSRIKGRTRLELVGFPQLDGECRRSYDRRVGIPPVQSRHRSSAYLHKDWIKRGLIPPDGAEGYQPDQDWD